MDQVGDLDLLIGGLRLCDIARVGRDPVGQLRDSVRAQAHHLRQRLTDDAVERDQDRERDQAPEAAGHRVDLLFPIELGHLFIELLLVSLVPALKLRDPRLKAAGTHHALLALGHERKQNQVHDDAEEDDRPTVAAGQLIESFEQPGKGCSNPGHKTTPILKFLGFPGHGTGS